METLFGVGLQFDDWNENDNSGDWNGNDEKRSTKDDGWNENDNIGDWNENNNGGDWNENDDWYNVNNDDEIEEFDDDGGSSGSGRIGDDDDHKEPYLMFWRPYYDFHPLAWPALEHYADGEYTFNKFDSEEEFVPEAILSGIKQFAIDSIIHATSKDLSMLVCIKTTRHVTIRRNDDTPIGRVVYDYDGSDIEFASRLKLHKARSMITIRAFSSLSECEGGEFEIYDSTNRNALYSTKSGVLILEPWTTYGKQPVLRGYLDYIFIRLFFK